MTDRGRARLVPLLACLLLAPALRNGFAHDDHVIAEGHPVVLGTAPAGDAFAAAYWPPGFSALQYRPLTLLSLRVDHALGGGSPVAFHATNLLLLAAIVLLLSHVLLQRGASPAAAALAAAAFALHPVHVEAVAPAVGRSELGAALFALAALALRPWWSRAAIAGGAAGWAATLALVACAGAAMLFKEHGVVVPAVLLVDVAFFDRAALRRPLDVAVPGVLLAATSVTFFGAHVLFGGGISEERLRRTFQELTPLNPLLEVGPAERLASALHVGAEAIRKLVLPWPLVVDYGGASVHVVRGWDDPYLWLAAALVVGCVVLAARARSPLVRWAAAVGVLFWLPVSHVVFASGIVFAERTLFLPSLAFVVPLALAVDAGIRSPSPLRSRAAVAIGAALAAAHGAVTLVRLSEWRDSCTLAAADVRRNPASPTLQRVDGICALRAGDLPRAGERARAALAVAPRFPAAHLLAAEVARAEGRLGAAAASARRAVELQPASPDARALLSEILWATGDRAGALRQARARLTLAPLDGRARRALADRVVHVGGLEEGQRVWAEGAALAPRDPGPYVAGGQQALEHGDVARAIRWASLSAERGAAGASIAWARLAHRRLGDGDAARVRPLLEGLVAIFPDEPALLIRLAAASLEAGDPGSARAALDRVVERFPGAPAREAGALLARIPER